ncbi:sigma-54-dependent transcriptional regulator [Jiella marina]|uniref:sigma-54-dependent transcriptional regulator n=1 Tax=Jiella sp. LLJ827 TaxID=2917712 RepID=UPI002101BDB5|nr:sigma-54 dependent transcriptional regulator [Jiella sp. LLJ827]MCQ0987569.1 sigma-54 dependent transcriptional regulator [Jiella sp. LLJ827]
MSLPTEPILYLVEDDPDLRDALQQGLELEGFDVRVHDAAGLMSVLHAEDYAVIVSDIRMPRIDGLELLRKVLALDPALPVILITGHGDVQTAVDAMQVGAYDFIEKPLSVSRLAAIAKRAVEKRRLVLENRVLRSSLDGADELERRLIGRSPGIRKLRQQILAIADTDIDVLVLGATGTGKEVVARALHECSTRREKNFVALNCAALPAEIFESELFGHEPGAFTGAQKPRVGKLEHADGGTIFLDEIESMPMDLQAKLLRAIEQRTIERLGSNKPIKLDVRFVAATKIDLATASEAGNFRSDLYFRLNVVTLAIPALRERVSDIPLLFFHLAREARARFRKDIPEVPAELDHYLRTHDWPGNVRELRNVADQFVLGMWSGPLRNEDQMPVPGGEGSLADQLALHERAIIEAELERHGGALKPTYEALQISRKGLYDRMQRLGLYPERR